MPLPVSSSNDGAHLHLTPPGRLRHSNGRCSHPTGKPDWEHLHLTPVLRRTALVLCLALLVLGITTLTNTDRVLAQTTLSMNKYLVATPPTSPTATSAYTNLLNPSVNTTYTYVISVNSPPGETVTITDAFPGFAAPSCVAWTSTLSGTAVTPTGTSYGPFTATSGSVGNVTLVCTGTFPNPGVVTNVATASSTGSGSGTATITSTVIAAPPTTDLAVTKSASAPSTPSGGVITYTIVVTNNSNVAVNLSNTVSLYDKIINNGPTELTYDWAWVGCVPSTGSVCFAPPTPSSATGAVLDNGLSANIFGTTGIVTTSGQLTANGGTMTITYTVTLSTFDPCAPTAPTIANSTYLGNGGSGGNFPDAVVSNNTANTTVTLTGLPTVCPPPPVSVTKVHGNVGTWTGTTPYKIKVTNISPDPVEFTYTDRVHTPAAAATVFDATLSNDDCFVQSAPTTCNHNLVPATFVGSAPALVITYPLLAPKVTLAPGEEFDLAYDAKYFATCQTGRVKIINTFRLKGRRLSSPPINTVVEIADSLDMPPLPPCKLKVTKILTPNGQVPLTFGAPAYGTYKIRWRNLGSTDLRLGAVWDVMSINSALYAEVPVTYTSPIPTPNCTTFPTGLTTWVYTSSPGTVNVNYATPPFQGAQVIRGSNAKLRASVGYIECTFAAKAGFPSPNDARCQTGGSPLLVNVGLGAIDPAYNPSTAPLAWASATKRLPRCRKITITKVPIHPIVLPGAPVTWTVNVTNNAQLPNVPIGGFNLFDTLGAGMSSPPPTCTPGCSLSSMPIAGLASGATKTFNVSTGSPAAAYTTGVNTVSAPPAGAGFYWHTGATPPSGSGSVYTAWPQVSKTFSPNSITAGGLTTVTFTITNLSYNPLVNGMAFTDQLPAGLGLIGPATGNTCGGTATLSGNSIAVVGASLASGTASCTINFQARPGGCGTFQNLASDVTGVVQLGTSGMNATLDVTGCNGSGGPTTTTTTTIGSAGTALPTITKSYTPIVGSFNQSLIFVINNPSGNGALSGLGFVDAMSAPTGGNPPAAVPNVVAPIVTNCGGVVTGGSSVTFSGGTIGAGPATCTITVTIQVNACGLFSNLASNMASTTLNTSGVNASFNVACAGSGSSTTTTSTTATTSTTSTTVAPQGTRTLSIEKINGNPTVAPVLTIPAGTYNFTIVCDTASFTAAIVYPSPGLWTSPGIPSTATNCVVTEQLPLPAAPLAWIDPIFYKGSPSAGNLLAGTGYSRTITLNAAGNTLMIVANRFR